MSHRKVACRCDCGKDTAVMVRNLTQGKTKTCGRCNEIPAEEMASRKFGKLRMKDPETITSGSNKMVTWVCDCGREHVSMPNGVINRHITSCGRCDNIPAIEMASRKFGKLRMREPTEVSPGSPRVVEWVCDCGKSVHSHVRSVVRGLRKLCGRCSEVSAEELRVAKFGKLRIKDPVPLTRSSTRKVTWVCDCGAETSPVAHHVLSGHTKSCGRCYESVRNDWDKHSEDIRKLRTPIRPEDVKCRFVVPLEVITNVSNTFRARCFMCGSEYGPRWDAIRLGHSLTCGCTTNRISTCHQEIGAFLRSKGIEFVNEKRIGPFIYDMFVPGKNLVIEMNGLLWHSRPCSRKNDVRKYECAKAAGLEFMSIYEDEWAVRRKAVESLILNKVGGVRATGVRPSGCAFAQISSAVANEFYESNHYIGGCRAPVNYGVHVGDRLVACMSLARPTRQSGHDWELVRMASTPDVRVHGVWSKLLKRFVAEHSPRSIVSFSDNRLFSGATYERLGFRMDKELPPDYYWWKNKRRRHKSGLRKDPDVPGTETEQREAQGYRKIWDLGKKRWVLTL